MGGDTSGAATRKTARSSKYEERVRDWLQWVIDLLASEYGWSKDHIFSLYPAEVEILEKKIEQRREKDADAQMVRLLIAARAPMTKDAGTSMLKQLIAKHKEPDMGDGVTSATRKRDLARARKFIARHLKKK